jgi:hypothetical protein
MIEILFSGIGWTDIALTLNRVERADQSLHRPPRYDRGEWLRDRLLKAFVYKRMAGATDQLPPIRSNENLRANDRPGVQCVINGVCAANGNASVPSWPSVRWAPLERRGRANPTGCRCP